MDGTLKALSRNREGITMTNLLAPAKMLRRLALAAAVLALGVAFSEAIGATPDDTASPSVLRLLQGPVPADPVAAQALVLALDQLRASKQANGLRAYVRRRDMEVLLGNDVPPSTSALEASTGPWSTEQSLADATRRFLTESFVVDVTRRDLAAAPGVSPWVGREPEYLIAPGLWGQLSKTSTTTHYDVFWIAATVTSRLNVPVRANITLIDGFNPLKCNAVSLPARSSAVVMCKSVYVSESEPELAELIAFKAGADVRPSLGGIIEGGSPLRHMPIDWSWNAALPYEKTEAVQVAAHSLLANVPCEDTNSCEPTVVDWALSKAGKTFLFMLALMAISVAYRVRTLGTGRAKGWPPAFFIAYLGFVGLTILVCLFEPGGSKSSQNPYGGLFSVLAKTVAGLPLSLSATQPGPPQVFWPSDDSAVFVVAIVINVFYLAFMTFLEDGAPRPRPLK